MDHFPVIAIPGDRFDPKSCIEPGTKSMLFAAFIAAIVGTLLGIVFSYGILLVVLLFYPVFAWYYHKKATALIHGSGVHVTTGQFPEIYQCVQVFKDRLGMTQDIDVYIVESNVANAAAVRYGKKNVVLLTDDLIHGCLASGNPHALSFVIGHELAHIALNHNGLVRSWMAKHLKKLGRLDELSADTTALRLVNDNQIAFKGLLMLTVGYALLPFVNVQSLAAQAQQVAENKYSKKAERTLSHPLLLNRLHRVIGGMTIA
jgi:Zn-dependent protease with chaperone function